MHTVDDENTCRFSTEHGQKSADHAFAVGYFLEQGHERLSSSHDLVGLNLLGHLIEFFPGER